MLNDIDKLRLVREKSRKRLKRTESNRINNYKNMYPLPITELEAERKRKTAEKQHEKLERI
jgi:hypothetical protein